jgi:hypothetical protein
MTEDQLQVREYRDGHAVYEGESRLTSVLSFGQARAQLGIIRKARRSHARLSMRSCLCCRRSFESEGPGNRLCKHCRSVIGSLDNQMVG